MKKDEDKPTDVEEEEKTRSYAGFWLVVIMVAVVAYFIWR